MTQRIGFLLLPRLGLLPLAGAVDALLADQRAARVAGV
jgi:transcriptional regulator GlxA family with amidase domain